MQENAAGLDPLKRGKQYWSDRRLLLGGGGALRKGSPSLSVTEMYKADVATGRRRRRHPLPPSLSSTKYYPWLIYCHGKSKEKMFGAINSPSDHSSCFGSIPELCGEDVIATFPDWLLLLDNSSDCYTLWHTSQDDPGSESACTSIDLPSLRLIKKTSKGKKIVHYYALLPSGSGGGGLVLVFDSTSPTIFCCRFTAPDEEEDVADHHRLRWTKIKYDKQMEYVNKHSGLTSIAIEPLLTCSSRLYGYPQQTGRLLVIDIVEHPGTTSKPYDVTITPSHFYRTIIPNRSFRSNASVVECEGELFLVQFVLVGVNHWEVLSVHVSKINFSDDAITLEEVGVSSMRDKCFFLDAEYHGSGFGLSRVPHGQGDRIYFLEWDSKSKYLYCFNMEDNSCSVSLPCPYLPTPWQTPVWVWPQSPAIDKLRVDDNTEDHKLPDNDDNKEVGNENMSDNDVDVEHGEDEEVLSNVSTVTHLFNVHPDVIKFIEDKLIPTDYLNFRASSTRCRLVSPPNHWKTVLADVDDITCLSAWLMFPSFDDIWNFLVPNHNADI